MLTKTTIKCLSICRCGFPVLKDEIGLGTEYSVDWNRRLGGVTFICGGCGHKQQIETIWVESRKTPGKPGGYLPRQIFEDEEA